MLGHCIHYINQSEDFWGPLCLAKCFFFFFEIILDSMHIFNPDTGVGMWERK